MQCPRRGPNVIAEMRRRCQTIDRADGNCNRPLTSVTLSLRRSEATFRIFASKQRVRASRHVMQNDNKTAHGFDGDDPGGDDLECNDLGAMILASDLSRTALARPCDRPRAVIGNSSTLPQGCTDSRAPHPRCAADAVPAFLFS
jgi:hypothetical protein